jgi:hypothetical protein
MMAAAIPKAQAQAAAGLMKVIAIAFCIVGKRLHERKVFPEVASLLMWS